MPLQQTEAAFQVISRVSRQDQDHQLGVKYCQLKLSQRLPLVTIRDQDVTCSGVNWGSAGGGSGVNIYIGVNYLGPIVKRIHARQLSTTFPFQALSRVET